MKATKKLLALVLAVCMLIGMPLSINVSAVGTSDASALALSSAMIVPEHIAKATGVDPRSIMLNFNSEVTIDTNAVDAVVTLIMPDGSTRNLSGYENNVGLAIWYANVEKCEAMGSNAYIVTFENGNVTWSTIQSALAWAHVNSNPGLNIRLRLFDKKAGEAVGGAGENQIDGNVNGITAGNKVLAANSSCVTNGQSWGTSSTKDAYDFNILTADEALTLKSATWVGENSIRITYSQPGKVRWDSTGSTSANVNSDVKINVGIVNSQGKLMYYCPDADGAKYVTTASGTTENLFAVAWPTSQAYATMTVTVGGKSTVAIDGFAAGSDKTMSWFNAHLAACIAENPTETYSISYVIQARETAEDANVHFYPARGEAANNWYISGFYGTNSGLPLLATHSASTAGCDSAIVALDVGVTSVTMLNGTTLQVTYTEPVHMDNKDSGTAGRFFGVRVIKDGKLLDGSHQMWQNSVTAVGGTSIGGKTYAKVWNVEVCNTAYTVASGGTIGKFAKEKYFNDASTAGLNLCFAIEENVVTGMFDAKLPDGKINTVYTADGRRLVNPNLSEYVSGVENFYVPIQDVVYTEWDAILGNDSTILIRTPRLSGVGSFNPNTYLRAYKVSDNTVCQLDGADAQWNVTVSNFCSKTSEVGYSLKGVIGTAFGTNKYSEICEKLTVAYGDDYKLELVVDDDTVNRISSVETYPQYQFLRPDANYSTAEKDVCVINLNASDIVAIESVNVYDAPYNAAVENPLVKKVVLTFTHDIDVEHFIETAGSGVILTTLKPDLSNWINASGGIGSAPAGQAIVVELQPYGNGSNKVIGNVYKSEYDKFASGLDTLKTANINYVAGVRIEMPTNYHVDTDFPLNYNIQPQDENVLSPMLSLPWDGGGRMFSAINIIEAGDNVIAVDGQVYGTVQEGFDKATSDSEIMLIADVNVASTLIVPDNLMLDLNGKTVTVDDNDVFWGFGMVIDNTDGDALICANKNTAAVRIRQDNPQMPLYDGTGYRFFNYALQTLEHITGENSATYGVHLDFTNKAAYTILSEQGSGSDLEFHMNVNTEQGIFGEDAGKDLRFNLRGSEDGADLIKKYGVSCVEKLNANGNVGYIVFTLKISGTNKIPAGDALAVKACAYSSAQDVDLTTFDNWTVLQ